MNYKHNRELVIKKGLELFWNNGYHNLGVDLLCKETGMTKGAFYNSFKSKEGFLLTAVEYYGDFIINYLKTLLSKSETSSFKKLLFVYDELLNAQPENNYKGCLVNNMMSEMAVSNPLVASLTELQFQKFVQTIEPTVKEAQKKNELPAYIDSFELSELIHSTFFGLLTRSRSKKKSCYDLMESFLKTLKTN